MRVVAPCPGERPCYATRTPLSGKLEQRVRKRVLTTTFTYDNGNVTQKTVDGTTTTYVWDYANRLIALGAGGATTTYGYDAFGQRLAAAPLTAFRASGNRIRLRQSRWSRRASFGWMQLI